MTETGLPIFVARPSSGGPPPLMSVVIPAWNEADRLPALLLALAERLDESAEVLVIDDGSTDRTAEIAAELGVGKASLEVVRHSVNRGKGAAVRTGVAAAAGRTIVFVDADNATDLDALAPMVKACHGSVGAAFGSRHVAGSVVFGSPPIRGLMGRIFNHVVRLAAGTTVADTQCGAKAFQGPLARVVFSQSDVDGWAFDVDVLWRTLQLGFEVTEYPVRWQYVAGTKISLWTPVEMLRDIVRIRRRSRPRPVRAVTVDFDERILDDADRLRPGPVPPPRTRVQVLLPAGLDAAPMIEAWSRMGLQPQIGESRTWAQDSGRSPS